MGTVGRCQKDACVVQIKAWKEEAAKYKKLYVAHVATVAEQAKGVLRPMESQLHDKSCAKHPLHAEDD